MKSKNELLMEVVDRYLYHSSYVSDFPLIQKMANDMADIELYEMWALTQGKI